MMITKFMYTIHRVLGTLLSILFLVLFLSAFVMMYHGFPRASQAEKLEKLEPLSPSLPSVSEITSRLPEGEKVKGIRLDRYLGQTIFHIRTDKGEHNLPADSVQALPVIDGSRIHRVASLWCNAPIDRIDTLNRLDQWIPFGSLKREFPIYKFHFADTEKHQLYIGSQSGEVLQFTTRNERFWAWLGAIPHWVYFTWLRQDAALWSITVIWLSGIGCLMTIAGLWVGMDVWRRSRKQKGKFSPYRKKWYDWHYVSGIVFGVIGLTFCFSGMMSLAEVPAWISKPVLDRNPTREIKKGAPKPDQYLLDYRQILTEYPDVRQVEWSNFRSKPYYIVKRSEGDLYIDASDSLPHPLKLDEKQVTDAVKEFISSRQYDNDKVLGISIATQGITSPDHTTVLYGDIMNNAGMKLDDFSRYLPYPCYLEHDSKSAAFLELWNHPELDSAVIILLNRNLGGGIITNHQIHQGISMHSGTLEHICINPDGPLCYCGSRGCLETYCSANALEQAAGIPAKEFFPLLREKKSPQIIQIWKDFLNHLAFAMKNLNLVIDAPIILSGYLAPYLTEEDIEYLAEHLHTAAPFILDKTQILVGTNGQYTPAIGAALHYVEKFIQSI